MIKIQSKIVKGEQKGFTIIELVVSIVVFLLVIGAVLSVFISVVQQQMKILSEQQLLSQISYVEEYMSKALRMAKADTSGSCLGTEGNIYELANSSDIKFINQSDNDACQEFFLDSDGVLKEIKNGSMVALTSSNLKINSLVFLTNGPNGSTVTDSDPVQPMVIMFLDVGGAANSQAQDITIQTTISQRNLNIKSQ